MELRSIYWTKQNRVLGEKKFTWTFVVGEMSSEAGILGLDFQMATDLYLRSRTGHLIFGDRPSIPCKFKNKGGLAAEYTVLQPEAVTMVAVWKKVE